MNSKDYRNIREAYLQVYTPQELTEEQVWEGVEEWVNSLLEEGYDLSDYTWEEMYEAYLEEQGGRGSAAIRNQNVYTIPTSSAGTRRGAAAGTKPTPDATPKISADRPVSKFVGARDAAIEKAKNIKGSPVVGSGSGNVTRPTVTPTAPRPNATSSGPKSTPTPTTPTKPVASTAPTAPTKPAIGTTPGGTKFERRTPTSAELSAAQDARAAGKGEEGAIKAGVEASKPTTPAPNPVKANVPGFALGSKPTEPKKTPITSGFDMFDVVKGYLIGEGYADTEEAALAIMANMSEDWKYSIMEQQMSSVSASAPSGVKKPAVTASISAGGKTPPGQKMLDKAGQMLSGKGPSNNFGRGF